MIKLNRLVFLVITLLILGCGKTEYSDVPSGFVNLTLYLGDKDKELNAVLSYKIFTHENINTSQREAAGFGGVIVYHSVNGFVAFDIACPYEVNAKTTIIVNPDNLTASCPKCESKYSLDFGAPMSGPSTENPERKRLRPYKVMKTGDKIYIGN